jgi:hypothetical protein
MRVYKFNKSDRVAARNKTREIVYPTIFAIKDNGVQIIQETRLPLLSRYPQVIVVEKG